MSTPIQQIPDESGMIQCNEEDSALVQSILEEIGGMQNESPAMNESTSSMHMPPPASMPMPDPMPEPVYEAFDSSDMYMSGDDGMLEFGEEQPLDDDDYSYNTDIHAAPASVPLSWKDRALQLLRIPLLAGAVVLLLLAPPVQQMVQTVVLPRLPLKEPLRGWFGSMILPAILVILITAGAQFVWP